MGRGRRVPGAIVAPTGRHPRKVPEHSRGSARLTALARAISETRPGNGSLEVEQRVCKIVGHVTELTGWDFHPLETCAFHGAQHKIRSATLIPDLGLSLGAKPPGMGGQASGGRGHWRQER